MPKWSEWAVPLGTGLAFLPLGYVLRVWLWAYLRRWAAKTPWAFDEILLRTLERHFYIWVALAAAFSSVHVAKLDADISSKVDKALGSLLVVSLTWLAIELFHKFLRFYAHKINLTVSVAPAIRYTVTTVILFLGALFLLSAVGVTTAPLLVLIGVVALVGAIALRNALPELFEGFSILTSRHITPGDQVVLEGGEEGEVVDIGWRSTRIHTTAGELLVPNTKLARANIKRKARRKKSIASQEAHAPFVFYTTATLTELTGLQARTLPQLVTLIKQAPPSTIYYHTMRFVRLYDFLIPQPRNDFAHWVSEVLQYKELGELLSTVDPCQLPSLEEVRARLIACMEEFMLSHPDGRDTPPGQEFYFMKAVHYTLPTSYQAKTLSEFVAAVEGIPIQSIYLHLFEKKLQQGSPTNDFSLWIQQEFDLPQLALSISRLEPYSVTGEGLRQSLARLVEDVITE